VDVDKKSSGEIVMIFFLDLILNKNPVIEIDLPNLKILDPFKAKKFFNEPGVGNFHECID
jgi:hypothetical protein